MWYEPHVEKPPMTYWTVAASMLVFGRNEWAVRLPLALAGISGVWASYLWGRALGGRHAPPFPARPPGRAARASRHTPQRGPREGLPIGGRGRRIGRSGGGIVLGASDAKQLSAHALVGLSPARRKDRHTCKMPRMPCGAATVGGRAGGHSSHPTVTIQINSTQINGSAGTSHASWGARCSSLVWSV